MPPKRQLNSSFNHNTVNIIMTVTYGTQATGCYKVQTTEYTNAQELKDVSCCTCIVSTMWSHAKADMQVYEYDKQCSSSTHDRKTSYVASWAGSAGFCEVTGSSVNHEVALERKFRASTSSTDDKPKQIDSKLSYHTAINKLCLLCLHDVGTVY